MANGVSCAKCILFMCFVGSAVSLPQLAFRTGCPSLVEQRKQDQFYLGGRFAITYTATVDTTSYVERTRVVLATN